MNGEKVFSDLDVKQRMEDKIRTDSDTVHGRWCLDRECLLGKIFSLRRFIIAFFFLHNGGKTFLCCAQEFPAWSFLEGADGTLASLKIILRALF